MKIITFRKLRHYWPVYMLVLPAIVMTALFAYFPAASAMFHSFYKWDGDEINVPVGLRNFQEALQDEVLFAAFGTVLVLIGANLVKMVPSIVTAVLIHRLKSDGARYIYRVMFVIPMIIPGMVWLLIWKYFYNPNSGVLNGFLNATGLMDVLQWLDVRMPDLAANVIPARDALLDPVGGIWGLGLLGVVILSTRNGVRHLVTKSTFWFVVLILLATWIWGDFSTSALLEGDFGATLMSVLTGLGYLAIGTGIGEVIRRVNYKAPASQAKTMSLVTAGLLLVPLAWSGWVALNLLGDVGVTWPTVLTGLMGLVFLAVAVGYIFRAVSGTMPEESPVGRWGKWMLAVVVLLVLFTAVWDEPTNAFERGRPAWLGQQKLILPALIFWGFPWVGVVSVLLYLSGLGNIDQSVYEAADIDGCGWFRKFWNIELPLITTQVRLNLVLMIIGTLKGWGLVYILLGDGAGPGGAGMLPGLYMFRKAFTDGRAGYACAIGLLLFLLILFLTLINNRYVRVKK